MKLQSKWFLVPLFTSVLAMLPASESAAHRTRDGAGTPARQSCGGHAGRQALARMAAGDVDPQWLAARDLIALECLYRRQGKGEKIEALYRDVLDKAKQPLLRSIAYRRLARMAWRRGEPAVAEQLLQRSLQEKLL